MLSQQSQAPEINLRLQQVSQSDFHHTTPDLLPRGHQPEINQSLRTNYLRRVAVIVFQSAAESGTTSDRRFQASDEFFQSHQKVANSLMIPLFVVMPQIFLQRPLQPADAKAAHLAQALGGDAAHPAGRERSETIVTS